jgi:hypothetical protein
LVFALEFDPQPPPRARLTAALRRLADEAFAAILDRLLEEVLQFSVGAHLPRHGERAAVPGRYRLFEGSAALAVHLVGQVPAVQVEHVEQEEGGWNLLHGFGDPVLAALIPVCS